MSGQPNPYHSSHPLAPLGPKPPSLPLGKRVWGGMVLGIQAGIAAAVIAFALFFVTLSLPFTRPNRFVEIWLFGGPAVASLGGLLGGIAFGLSRNASPRTNYWASKLCGMIPGLSLIWTGLLHPPDLRSDAAPIVIILFASLTARSLAMLLFSNFHSRWLGRDLNESNATHDVQCQRALWLSLAGVIVPTAVMLLAAIGILQVTWNSNLIPLSTLFLGFFHFLLATSFSIYCRIKQRDWRATLATIIAMVSLPYWLFTAWLLAMLGLAAHPI